jgi:hypothetical protein
MSRAEQSEHLTKKELAFKWGVSIKTVQRDIKRFKLKPAYFTGIQPLFAPGDVEAMEARRLRHRMKQGHYAL